MIKIQWLIFAILSAVFVAMVSILSKIGLKNIDPTLATGVRSVVMFIFMVLVLLFTKKFPELSALDKKSDFYIIFAGIAGALSWIFYFIALKLGKASQVAPIDKMSVVLIIIFAALFLGEKFTLKIALGTLLLAAGTLLIILG